ncbi:MAG: SDR family oxidoreductase [Deltaproteobacteria bacterium]|nr:SDR family oxidoreductase [Deltaproteobacteria bacterium]
MRLKDRIALVTGAAGDIGKATAQRFAEEGAVVIVSDIDEPGCRRTASEIEEQGGRSHVIQCDLTSEEQLVGMFAQLKKEFGRLDILANVAGGDYEPMVGLEDITDEKMSLNLAINLKSCIFCCREAANMMIEQQYGKIINMCSILYRGGPTPMQHTYAATKGAIYSFTRSLAMSHGVFNINVNGIAPSLIEVDALKKGMGEEMFEAVKKDCAERYPLGRVGKPLDIANCALFLASEESSFITGQIIEVTGGSRL